MSQKKIAYYSGDEIVKQEVKIKNNIIKKKATQDKLDTKLRILYEKGQSGKRVKPERLVKLSNKVFLLEQSIIRDNINLSLLTAGTLVKPDLITKVKNWFSEIKYYKQRIIWGYVFIIPWAIGMLIFFMPSLLSSILWSFSSVELVTGGASFNIIGIDNFVYLFTDYVIDNTSIFSVQLFLFIQNLIIDLPVIIIFSILIAIMLNKKFKGHLIVKSIFFIPVIYNFAVISTTLSGSFGELFESNLTRQVSFVNELTSFFLEIGIGESLMGIVLTSIERIFTIVDLSGIQILIFIAAIQSVPRHLYEAAQVEGATKYEMFWKITIPMITPMIITAAIYTVVDSFTRAPIFRFLDYAMTDGRYGLAAAISVSYFVINIVIIGIVFLLFRGRVFYYDEE